MKMEPWNQMKRTCVSGLLGLACLGLGVLHAASGRVEWVTGDSGPGIRVRGDEDDDWWIQESPDLVNWTDAGGGKPLLGGGTNAPVRLLGTGGGPTRFVRALRTAGLFDDTVVRTLSLTFTQANWQTSLTTSRTTGVNTKGAIALDNGASMAGIGARYKGNTSFTGMGSAPTKKSINLVMDETDPLGDLMGYETLNLNNAYQDETIFREALYFNVMRRYAVCSRASLAKVYINDAYWGLYSFVQQEDGDLVKEWFPSSDGDRWRAPNIGGGTGGGRPGGGGPGGGGGGFASAASALSYLGASVSSYTSNYELKTTHSTNAWERLVHVIDVLNNTPSDTFRDKVEEVLAVDRWLWFLVLENVFSDDDSYFNKGADYAFYYEPETGRIHPIEHDGNESFLSTDAQLSPVQGATGSNRPVISKLLAVPELRQRYLAHMRTVLKESFNPDALYPIIDRYQAMTVADVAADTKKGYTMTAYTNDVTALKTFIRTRHAFLTNHAELKPLPPEIVALSGPTHAPTAAEQGVVTTEVRGQGGEGIDSVWLYFRTKSFGRFTTVPMLDDGAHGDGPAGDGVFGAFIASQPAGTKVRYYVEARSANASKAAAFRPVRAEEDIESYRVSVTTAPNSPVVINEFMASNAAAVRDPQREFDDWIELKNVTDGEVDLSGHYLSDEPTNPRKWAFPAGTRIPAGGYLVVWADEDGSATEGLHASFKLDAGGEQLFLTDTDANLNAILDSVVFGAQATDRSQARSAADEDVWMEASPTPGGPNP